MCRVFPLDIVPWLLLLFGIGSTLGVLLGGRLADWKLMASLTGILAVQVVIYALMGVFVAAPWAMAVLVLIWGSTVFAFGSPVQTRILSNTQDAPLLAASLIPSAFNISIAAGAWLGGVMIDSGLRLSHPALDRRRRALSSQSASPIFLGRASAGLSRANRDLPPPVRQEPGPDGRWSDSRPGPN